MIGLPWFIDAGFWIALRNRRDQYHRRAQELRLRLRRRLVTTEPVLIEVGDALSKRATRIAAVELLTLIRANPAIEIVPLTPVLLERAISLYATHQDKEWGLTDCISFVVMRERGLHEALAADQHFVQAGFRALLLEP